MPRNCTLSYEQETAVRAFLSDAETYDLYIPRDVMGWFMKQLDYKVLPNGNRVATDTEVRIPFGGNFDDYPDEFDRDWDDYHDSPPPPASTGGETEGN